MFSPRGWIFGLLVGLGACAGEEVHEVGLEFELLDGERTGIDFTNTIEETEENNHLVWESIYNGGGVGIGDINNDGLQDVYFTGNMVADRLYLNLGDFKFRDITKEAGINETDWSSGVVMADVNNDGFMDIYVCKMSWKPDPDSEEERKNALYINNGDLTFTERAEELGLADAGHSTQAVFFDFNHDDFLDVYVMNAPSHRYEQKLMYNEAGEVPYAFKDHLYINQQGKFTDVSAAVLPRLDDAYGLGLMASDFNEDGWIDLYVANDFEQPDFFLINEGGQRLVDRLKENLKHTTYSSMGMDIGDINNDGLLDIAVLDMQSNNHVRSKTNMPSMDAERFWQNVARGHHFQYMANTLQLNNGMGFYSEIAQLAGIANTDWSWSPLMLDADNDGLKDIFVTNGINRNIKDNDFNVWMEKNRRNHKGKFLNMALKTQVEKVSNFAFRNAGDLSFADVSTSSGFGHAGFSFGSAYGDLDNDGDLDLVVNNNNERAHIYQNKTGQQNNHIQFQLTRGGRTDLNSRVFIYYDDAVQVGELNAVRGYQSCSEQSIHFGLGSASKIDSAVVVFSRGERLKTKTLKAGSTYLFDASEGRMPGMVKPTRRSLFSERSDRFGMEYFHVENVFNDFNYQVLMPHMETANGPHCAVGDVNGDGLDDVYLSASKDDFGVVYVQDVNGRMRYLENPAFLADQRYEDGGCAFFDVDRDGDLDLYVSSGGGEYEEGHGFYEDRLYLNDGTGRFERAQMSLPRSNASVVCTLDYNGDGWMDVFVGGRMKPLTYPEPGRSHLLINEGGKLSSSKNLENEYLGMVTDAVASDLDGDGDPDLIVVGEWMSPTFLINKEGGFMDESSQYLPIPQYGWWFDIEVADLDGDGVVEVLLGNIGLNNKYHPSKDKPLKVYARDFDKDQKPDVVLAKTFKDREVPVRGFECSSEQLPELKKRFESYRSFAEASISDLIDTGGALTLVADNFASGYLKKTREGYTFFSFPNRAQLSAVRSFVVGDFNRDGFTDVFLAGNLFEAEVETTRHDASVGLMLAGSPSGFDAVDPRSSGFYAGGNVRDMKRLKIGNKTVVLVMNNQFAPMTFQWNEE